MRIALAQVDGKWPNLALAKFAAFYQSCGDEVSLFEPLFGQTYDAVIASKVFADSPDDPYLPKDAYRGGSGYDLSSRLIDKVEAMKPDWSLWPWWTKDMGYSTRGCPRRCRFCNVREKDGDVHVVAEFAEIWTGRRDLVLLDGNIIAAPIEHLRTLTADAKRARVRLDYSQGLDARLLTDEHVALVLAAPHARNFHLAFDNMADETAVRRAIALFRSAGYNLTHVFVFVLVGFDTTEEEDLYRIDILRAEGVVPFVMVYDRSDRYQRRLARWVNRPALFNSCSWADFGKVSA